MHMPIHDEQDGDGASLTPMTALKAEFETAAAEGQIRLAYQPRLDLASGRVVGMEALLRWDHPTLGQMNPAMFLEAFDDEVSIRALTRWVLVEAVTQARAWDVEGRGLRVSVNVTIPDLADPGFPPFLEGLLEKTGLSAGLLELELSEIVADWDNMFGCRDQLGALSRLGVHMSIDEFGLGRSFLSFLAMVPATSVKLDRSFVIGMPYDKGATRMVRALCGFARGADMRVVAVGVETSEQVGILRGLGVDEVQGYLVGRPARPAEAVLVIGAPPQLAVAA